MMSREHLDAYIKNEIPGEKSMFLYATLCYLSDTCCELAKEISRNKKFATAKRINAACFLLSVSRWPSPSIVEQEPIEQLFAIKPNNNEEVLELANLIIAITGDTALWRM